MGLSLAENELHEAEKELEHEKRANKCLQVALNQAYEMKKKDTGGFYAINCKNPAMSDALKEITRLNEENRELRVFKMLKTNKEDILEKYPNLAEWLKKMLEK